jgi:hypothetical protein
MNARRLLQRMCARHQVPVGEAERLLPLLERALASSSRVRLRVLNHIERALAKRNEGTTVRVEEIERDLDSEVLVSVARLLHRWSPSQNSLGFGDLPEGLMPDGLDG